MIKKFVTLVALSIAMVNGAYSINVLASEPPDKSIYTSEEENSKISESKPKCPCNEDKKEDKKKDTKKECKINDDIKMLNKDCNKKLLSDDEIKSLDKISKCVKDKKEITEEEKKFINCLKDKVAKAKLGDDCFKKFQELLKKDNDNKLSEDEKKELKGYIKKIMD